MTQVLLLYMPVIHRGYLDFVQKHAWGEMECLLIGQAALQQLGPEADYILRKDLAIRGLPEEHVRQYLLSLNIFKTVSFLEQPMLLRPTHIRCPDEDVSHLAVQYFFPGVSASFYPTRLRYDRKGVERKDAVPATECTSEEAHRELMGKAEAFAGRSKDWWLYVGALLSRDGVPLVAAWNMAYPDPDIQNVLGDPRSLYSRGQGTDDTLVRHAERGVVSQAARKGIPLLGADGYVSHFPCVPCGAAFAEAGIKRLFFREGYSRLESIETFTTRGIQVLRVI